MLALGRYRRDMPVRRTAQAARMVATPQAAPGTSSPCVRVALAARVRVALAARVRAATRSTAALLLQPRGTRCRGDGGGRPGAGRPAQGHRSGEAGAGSSGAGHPAGGGHGPNKVEDGGPPHLVIVSLTNGHSHCRSPFGVPSYAAACRLAARGAFGSGSQAGACCHCSKRVHAGAMLNAFLAFCSAHSSTSCVPAWAARRAAVAVPAREQNPTRSASATMCHSGVGAR